MVLVTALAVTPLHACAGRHRAGDDWLKAMERWARLPEAQKRASLHETLRHSREPHDAYIDLIGLADETTVPVLLYRLHEDYGAFTPPLPPTPPRELPATPTAFPLPPAIELQPAHSSGFPCTWVHLIDALKSVTNADVGM